MISRNGGQTWAPAVTGPIGGGGIASVAAPWGIDVGATLRVTVTATNSAGSSSADSNLSEQISDMTAPVAPRVTKPLRAQTLMPRLNVAWANAEEGASYTVRYKNSSPSGQFGDYETLVTDTPERTARLKPRRGR